MDYLDPNKQHRHNIILMIGYVFVTVAIVIATLVLVYQAYGFGLGKNGTVIQSGLVFFSSQPNPADIYLNGSLKKAKTNARLVLPADMYKVKLIRADYRTWQRTIEVDGGSVTHFDYPFLVPTKLKTTNLQSYATAPPMTTQSLDHRWLMVQTAANPLNFDEYDLKSPTKPPTIVSLPSTVVSVASTSQTWQPVEWADDNQHVVLQHIFDGKTEFILFDRQNPSQSVNLNTTLTSSPTKLTLNNHKFDQYYIYDSAGQTLRTASLGAPAPVSLLTRVLGYQSYGNDSVLYATDTDAPAGKVLVKLIVGKQNYIIHTFSAGTVYLLDIAKYSGTLYVTAGASSENKVYIYRDPIGQLNNQPTHAITPIQVLHVNAPDYLSFSSSAQFIVTEHAAQFGVYDIENKNGYNYSLSAALDAPQTHVSWMDGNRLSYVSSGKTQIFDYDGTNQQALMPASANYLPAFAPDYRYVYGLAPAASAAQLNLTQTALRTPADL